MQTQHQRRLLFAGTVGLLILYAGAVALLVLSFKG